ncbi:hypothetical protein E2K99_05770 [Herbaspirillum huttiense]|uniref:ATP-binding domain-containing protein n=1 Tax=Herbaspirillum huttiense TaxID=863372 RepID=UPI001064CA95|nr:ATP-binding domain-containing protein [Herbaspirillum huttiense]QBP74552.1 hypothetical protein E2K99_05770 [Herbaspirillum huttiense]
MSGTWWVEERDLLEEQLEVLSVDLTEDLFLSGPPGSGKTNLLLLRANHMVIASPEHEFYIICFTSLLQKFIRTGATIYSFPENRIITQHRLFEQVLGDHGFLPPRIKGESYSERDAALLAGMDAMMKAGVGKDSYPILFIDEAQDYSKEVLTVFKYLARNLTCAGDLRQGIYGAGVSGATWLREFSWSKSINLKFHHRVAPAIIDVADKIMNGKFDHVPMMETHQYKGDVGSVDVQSGIPFSEQLIRLVSKLIKQLAVYPGQIIGVLVPHRKDVEYVVAELLKNLELRPHVTNAMSPDFAPELRIWVSTVHSSKGLEFRCAHIVAADDFKDFQQQERRVAFMAVTRAKTALNIYHENALHPFFASALAKPNSEKVTVKRIFGKAL